MPSMPIHSNAHGPQAGFPAPYGMPMNAPTPNALYGYAVLPQAPSAPAPGNIPIPGTGRLVENPYVQQATRANDNPNRYQMVR